jgi:hypothetical protein
MLLSRSGMENRSFLRNQVEMDAIIDCVNFSSGSYRICSRASKAIACRDFTSRSRERWQFAFPNRDVFVEGLTVRTPEGRFDGQSPATRPKGFQFSKTAVTPHRPGMGTAIIWP